MFYHQPSTFQEIAEKVMCPETKAWRCLMDPISRKNRAFVFDPLQVAALSQAAFPYLYYQADMNNIPIAQGLLNCGVSPNVQGKNGKVPLHTAAERGFVKMTKLLLENQADTEIKDCKRKTPLQYAAIKGYEEIVDLLLGPKTKKGNLKKALLYAFEKEHVEVVTKLINYGADVNINDQKGVSLIAKSVEKGDADLVDLILQSKHKVEEDSLRRAFSITLLNEDLNLANRLLDYGVDVNGMDFAGTTHLQLVVPIGKEEVVSFLLLNNADPDISKNRDQPTPLFCAVKNNSYKVAKELLGFCANANAETGNENVTPLSIAMENQRFKMAKLLLEYRANVNHMQRSGQTELCLASGRGDAKGVNLLLRKGADVNARKDRNCLTPLHAASANGCIKNVNLLLNAKASADPIEKEGLTPLMMASRGNHEDVVRVLIQYGAKINQLDRRGKTALYHAAEKHYFDLAKNMLRKRASVEAPSSHSGKTLLYLAAKNNDKHVAKFLLDHEADVNAKDRKGRPLICRAARHGEYQTVNNLYYYGADLSEKDTKGKSALNHAASQGCVKVVKFLVQQKGCNLLEKDGDDLTACQAAKKNGHIEVYQILRDLETVLRKKRRRSLNLAFKKRGSNRVAENQVGAGSFNGS